MALLVSAALARLDGVVWLGSVARELSFQLFLCALVLGAVAAWLRAWPALAVCSLLALWWGTPIMSMARSTRPTPSTGPTLRVLSAHLAAGNLAPSELLTDLVSHKVDVAVLSAVNNSALAPLSTASALRNYRMLRSTADEAPWLAFVRKELSSSSSARASKQHAGVQVRLGSCELTVRPLSLPSLFDYSERQTRAERLRALRSAPRQQRSVWLGHLGSLPSASDVAPLLDKQELRDGRLGYGRMPSWPGALAALGFPLEHVLVHGWLRITALSMHEPLAARAQRTLRATIELTEPSCRSQP